MLPDIDSTFFHVLCGNLIVSKGSLYVYLFELNLRNLLYVIQGAKAWVAVKQNSMWNDVKLSGPETIKNHTYKYWHKFARVAKKEGHWSDMFKYYWNYCCSKVLGK